MTEDELNKIFFPIYQKACAEGDLKRVAALSWMKGGYDAIISLREVFMEDIEKLLKPSDFFEAIDVGEAEMAELVVSLINGSYERLIEQWMNQYGQ